MNLKEWDKVYLFKTDENPNFNNNNSKRIYRILYTVTCVYTRFNVEFNL